MWQEKWSKSRKKFKVYPWSNGKKILGKRRFCWLTDRAILLSTASACEESVRKSSRNMERENRLVYEVILMLRVGPNRRGADGVRVEKFPRIHSIADSRRDPEHDDWNSVWIWALPRADYLFVNVQWHCAVRKRKRRIVYLRIPKS